MLKLKLSRNLRKKLKQGHPWVYKEALDLKLKLPREACFAVLLDNKGEVSKGIFDPTSVLAFRALEVENLNSQALLKAFSRALDIRSSIDKSKTNAYRWVAGEGDGLSGLIVDVYGAVAVVQCDGEGMEGFWLKQNLGELLLKANDQVKTVVLKLRSQKHTLERLAGEELKEAQVQFLENEIVFETDLEKAQKTGFFLDQRDNRAYVETISKDKSVWNVFSYTGGFSIYAGRGGAKKVYSVDVSQGAIDQAQKNWDLNQIKNSEHEGLCVDAFSFLEKEKLNADVLIVDPPSMTSSKTSKSKALEKYKSLFASAARQVKPGGDLILSSCSSQISFKDFGLLASEALSAARRKGKVLRVSGQGVDHPYPHACEEMRYLKFMHFKLD